MASGMAPISSDILCLRLSLPDVFETPIWFESDAGNSMSRRRNAGDELIHHKHTPVSCHSNRTTSFILEKNMAQ